MVVITAAFLVAFQPKTCCLVKVFTNIGFATHVLTLHIFLEFGKIERVCDNRIAIVVHVVSHSRQRLTGGKGPHGTVPLAFAHTMRAELWMTTLGSSLSVRGRESLWVTSLKPGNGIFGFVLCHVGVPRHEADSLTDIGTGIDAVGFKECMILVPKLGVNLLLQVSCLLEVGGCFQIVASQLSYIADSFCITVHVTIDAGPQVLLLSSATDGFLHGVLHVSLPIEASLAGMRCLPMVIFPLQRR